MIGGRDALENEFPWMVSEKIGKLHISAKYTLLKLKTLFEKSIYCHILK